jgi:pyruvate,water dikinase
MNKVLGLDAVSKQSINLAGGKGANLGELIREGFPVPPGFVVTAECYSALVSSWPLTELSPAEIRDRIMAADLESQTLLELSKHHDLLSSRMGREFVYAVRSSATAEDLGDASFAGQHDTYYYVTKENLAHMVKKCWASLWSDAACSYRQSQGIAHDAVAMAVVVQVMIESDISGITFTANPMTGNRDEIVTEASWGMGAAIVDGRVSPDQYIYNRTKEDVVTKRIADKKFMVPATLTETESRLVQVPALQRRLETLDAKHITTLIAWAEKSEAYFACPQDIEWAFHGDEFYILQSRPITTLGTEEEQIPAGKYILFKPMAENFTDPLLPLSQDIFVKALPILTMIRGRAYLNLQHLRPLFPFKMTDQQISQLAYLSDSANFNPRLSILKLFGLSIILYINYLLMGVFYYRTARMPDDFMSSFRDLFQQAVEDEKLDAPGLMQKLFFRPRFFEPVGNMVIWVNLSAPRYILLLGVLNRLLKFWLPDIREDAASYLTSGTEGVLSTDMGRRIWYLAQQAKQSPSVVDIIIRHDPKQALPILQQTVEAQNFMQQVKQFLSIHGHRTLKEFELNSVRWEEDPAPVIAMIRNYLQADIDPSRTEQKVEQERAAFAAEIRTALMPKFLESGLGWRWQLIDALRRATKYYIRLRENSRFYHIMVFYGVRKKVLQVEASLLAAGSLKCKDDIFYLIWDEVKALQSGQLTWLDVEDRIRERRMEYIRLSKTAPAKAYGFDFALDAETPANDSALLRGQGASPGRCEGIARVIMDPGTDATVAAGEILVAPYTDPAWTPLFLTASAAVVEVGSYLSHAGTIAREYGMPCVVDAENCTERIKTGDRIVVDGSTGTVSLMNEMTQEVA